MLRTQELYTWPGVLKERWCEGVVVESSLVVLLICIVRILGGLMED